MISNVSIAPTVYTAGSPVAGGAYTFTMQGVPKRAVPLSWLRPDLGAAPSIDFVNIAGVGVGLLAVGLATIMILKARRKRR